MNSVYHQALEDLAAKRRAIDELIVSLARAAGIDPAPYRADAVPPATSEAPARAPRRATEKPPRPQRPASRATNGTARAAKVDSEIPGKVLVALKQHGAPMQPKDLATALRLSWSTVAYHVKKLEAAGRVTLSGTTFDRRIALA